MYLTYSESKGFYEDPLDDAEINTFLLRMQVFILEQQCYIKDHPLLDWRVIISFAMKYGIILRIL